jgi:reactive intermediate/imine deaminase
MKTAAQFFLIVCLGLVTNVDTEAQQQNQRSSTPQKTGESKMSTKSPVVEYLSADISRALPFSDAVRVDHMLYLSGQLGTDQTRALVPGGIKAETKQVMENIRSILERHGSSFDRVVKCTVMLADMSEWAAMNEIYVPYFAKGRLPARSAFGVNGLARGARVEIECLATVK